MGEILIGCLINFKNKLDNVWALHSFEPYVDIFGLVVFWAFGLVGSVLIYLFIKIRTQIDKKGKLEQRGRSCSCSSVLPAMAGLLQLEPAAAPATVLESEGTGRERRARGFYFGDSGHGKQRSAPAAWQSWPCL